MHRVLIAEDEAFTAIALADTLQDRGHIVKDAPDGAAALDILEDFPAQVLITDLMMPRLDGAELIRQVRGKLGREIAIILITGVPESKLPADISYDAYLGKPVDHDILGRLVETLAEKSAG